MSHFTALEERTGATPTRLAEPQQYIVVAVEHDRKSISIHMNISLLNDTLLYEREAIELMASV